MADQSNKEEKKEESHIAIGQKKREAAAMADQNNKDEVNPKLLEQKDNEEDQILKMEGNVFQLANYYVVFQGLILAAVISGTSKDKPSLKCEYAALPIAVALFAATLNLVSLWIISNKYKDLLNKLDRTIQRIYRKKYSQKEFEDMKQKHKKQQCKRHLCLVLSMVLLVMFSVGNLVGMGFIICGDD